MKPMFTRPVVIALLTALFLTGGQAVAQTNTDAALDLITIEHLEDHVRFLGSDVLLGRDAGELGYGIAAQYVAERLGSMGVVAAGTDGWFQPVPLRRYGVVGGSAELLIHRGGESTALQYRDDYSMFADPVREASEVRAEVVYVGHGVHAPDHGYSDYEGVDVRGKIIALFRGAPASIEGNARAYYSSSTSKAEEAVARGAIGAISLRTRKSEERQAWASLKGRIGKRPSTTWISADGRAARYYPEMLGGASLSIEAAERLFGLSPLSYEEALQANLGGTVASTPLGVEVTLSAQFEHSTTSSPNVIGVVRGTDPELANEYVVYSAHLDHVGVSTSEEDEDKIRNGVYDNAMGVALMLETARAIAAAPPKRSVLFIALTAEESGLLGSDFFVNNPTVPIESIVANINLDMPLFLYPVADLVAFGSQHSSMHGVAEASAGEEGFVFSPDPMPEEVLFVRSDQYSFVQKGVPAVYLVTGFKSTDESVDGEALFRDHFKNHYHQPSDDMTRPIDWESALRFARAHTRIGLIVGDAEDRPTWNEGDFFGERFGRGSRSAP